MSLGSSSAIHGELGRKNGVRYLPGSACAWHKARNAFADIPIKQLHQETARKNRDQAQSFDVREDLCRLLHSCEIGFVLTSNSPHLAESAILPGRTLDTHLSLDFRSSFFFNL